MTYEALSNLCCSASSCEECKRAMKETYDICTCKYDEFGLIPARYPELPNWAEIKNQEIIICDSNRDGGYLQKGNGMKQYIKMSDLGEGNALAEIEASQEFIMSAMLKLYEYLSPYGRLAFVDFMYEKLYKELIE